MVLVIQDRCSDQRKEWPWGRRFPIYQFSTRTGLVTLDQCSVVLLLGREWRCVMGQGNQSISCAGRRIQFLWTEVSFIFCKVDGLSLWARHFPRDFCIGSRLLVVWVSPLPSLFKMRRCYPWNHGPTGITTEWRDPPPPPLVITWLSGDWPLWSKGSPWATWDWPSAPFVWGIHVTW